MSLRGLGAWALAGLTSAAVAAAGADAVATLTADRIVEKNVAARGGLEAWRKVQTMAWTGHLETDNPSAPMRPFVLEYKRPNKSRFEITGEHEKSVRVFDGAAGWKMRTSSSVAPSVKPYNPLEVRSAHDAQGIDGLLIDHQAKGIEVSLEGTDDIEGRRAYRLNVKLPSGSMRHVWVDAQTFLEVKSDHESHAPRGGGIVSVFYRNYRTIDGLQMPMTIETDAPNAKMVEKVVIDAVTLNPSLSDAHFERPAPVERRHAAPGLRSGSPPAGAPNALGSK